MLSNPASAGPLIKSDSLTMFRRLGRTHPELGRALGLERVTVSVDVNVVLGDLLWMATRRQPEGRTNLLEAMDAGTVLAFAPRALESKVLEKIDVLAEEEGVSAERLREEWVLYRKRISFHDPQPQERPAIVPDPEDLPYLDLHLELATDAVYSQDRHLRMMGAPVIDKKQVLALRNYSRAAASRTTLQFAGGVTIVLVLFPASCSECTLWGYETSPTVCTAAHGRGAARP
jgi:predicted nucleic acid-binding protein